MSIQDRKVLTREKRLTTISHYDGEVNVLMDELSGQDVRQRIRTFTQDTYGEVLAALQILSTIEDIAIVVHGAVGCARAGVYFNQKYQVDGREWYVTNLDEKDTILGGDTKLRETILRVYEEKNPKAIFVVGTPVIAINNDDVAAVLLELEEEIPTKLAFIDTDGFKSKAAINGLDIVAHVLLRNVVKQPSKKQDFINLISFSEQEKDIKGVTDILDALGISWNLLPQFSNYENIEKAADAAATIVLNQDEGGYFAQCLEEAYSVPYIKTPFPVGSAAIRKFIRKLSSHLQLSNGEAYEKEQHQQLKSYISKKVFREKKVFLNLGISKLKEYAALVTELGGEVVGAGVPALDPENKKRLQDFAQEQPNFPVAVLSGQPFELANLIQKTQADVYISEDGDFSFLNGSKCLPLSLHSIASVGYEGIREITDYVLKLENFAKHSSFQGKYFEPLYKDAWLKRSSNWYVKQEVK